MSTDPRAKFYRLGAKWRWRVIKFSVNGLEYRILVAYRTDKEQFTAIVGVNEQNDTRVLASLEFHGTHGGWHIHYAREHWLKIPAGIRRGHWVTKWDCRNHRDFIVSGSEADRKGITIVTEVFGLGKNIGDGAML